MDRRGSAPEHPCAFDLAVLAGCAQCSRAGQTHVGERIVVGCHRADSAARCRALLDQLRENAGFVFRHRGPASAPTHAEALRLRCGGLAGLAEQFVAASDAGKIGDVDALVERIGGLPGGLDTIAWDRVVRAIAAWRMPGRRRRR